MAAAPLAGSAPLVEVAWHVSTRSGSGGGNCVEAGPILDGSGRVAVRDSKDRAGHVLVYTAATWSAFITALKQDQLTT